MHGIQLSLLDVRSDNCPFESLLDEEDNLCSSLSSDKHNDYDFIGENDPRMMDWLAEIGGLGFHDITVQHQPTFSFPIYIPTCSLGSKTLFAGRTESYVGITLQHAIQKKSGRIYPNLKEKLGIPVETKLILLAYGKDEIIECIWGKRNSFYESISVSGVDVVTAINYSLWLDQPHFERLMNLKRSLITFDEMQKLGLPCIPHMYWSGNKDLERWAEWIHTNPEINTIAINLQTLRGQLSWDQSMRDLKYFVSLLSRKIHFLVSGPSTFLRIQQIQGVLGNVSITNSTAGMWSGAHQLAINDVGVIKFFHSKEPVSVLMSKNSNLYLKMMKQTQLKN